MPGKNNTAFHKLVQKYLDGTASPQEQQALDAYYQLFRDEPEMTGKLTNEKLTLLEQRIESGLFERIHPPVKVRRLWPRIAVAAAVATVVFGAALFYSKLNTNQSPQTQAIAKNDVAPGKQGATLTLANGKQIRLSEALNGEVAKEAGVSITKSADGQLVYEIKDQGEQSNKVNTLSTANGETYRVRLPDGSMVWLNAGSSLTYSASLIQQGKRSVRLTGEGYFEVAKDKTHPFVVESRGQQVEVLGTHFDVNGYADEKEVATTLLEGSVKVSAGNNVKVIAPGEQALTGEQGLRVRKVDAEQAVDWKSGDFNLEGLNFKVAMRKIARWYDIEVVYGAAVPDDFEAGGWISRNKPLSEVIRFMESSGVAKFQVDGKKLYVSKYVN